MSQAKELLEFLSGSARKDLRKTACSTISQLTGSSEGLKFLSNEKELLLAIIRIIDDEDDDLCKDAMKTLVNLSAEEAGSNLLLCLTEVDVVKLTLQHIEDPEYSCADLACAVLANVTHFPLLCKQVIARLNDNNVNKLYSIAHIICQVNYNRKGRKLYHLSSVIANLSQIKEGRRELMNSKSCVLQRLLPLTTLAESRNCRFSIISALHNCCFDSEYHAWLLSDKVDLISHLVFPLAGPDMFTIEENESLPLDFQFLPDDKERESDPVIRKLILQALMQLCSKCDNRKMLRDKNIYLILREYHKWEKDECLISILEDLVNILIRTEEEIGVDDISSLDVPQDLVKQFESMSQ